MAEEEKTEAKEKKRGRLTPTERAEGIALYRAGEITLQGLADRYSVGIEAWKSIVKKLGIKKGDLKLEQEKKAAAAIEAALTIDPAVYARRVYETKNETYRIIEMLRKLTVSEIVKARQAGTPLGAIQNDMKTIREAAAAIRICREEAYAVLGITAEESSDDQLPELKITGLDDEQIADLQADDPSDDELDAAVEAGGDRDLDLSEDDED